MTTASYKEAQLASAETLLAEMQSRIEAGGIEDARLEARWIVEDVLGCDYARIRAGLAADPAPEQAEMAFRLVRARLDGAPLAHVLEYTEFYGRRFRVSPGVMVPRNETETLVDTAINVLDEGNWEEPSVLDCYTGCGSVLLSVIAERPLVHGVGIDIDPDAISCAEANRDDMRQEKAVFIRGDVADELERFDCRFHLVTANPPYVASGDIPALPREIREHERRIALDGGPDGLDQFRVLATKAGRVIVPGGFLVVEIGAGQQDAVAEVFRDWKERSFRLDLSGIPRVLIAQF